MKRTCLAWLCAAVLMASQPAQAPADELDDLLSGTSPVAAEAQMPVADQGVSAAVDTPAGSLIDEQPRASYADDTDWQHKGATVARHGGGDTAGAAEPKPAAADDASAVPEPSALILAGLALLYFLVFGRRRRIG